MNKTLVWIASRVSIINFAIKLTKNMAKVFKLREVVWAKLRGYPYWPAQVSLCFKKA